MPMMSIYQARSPARQYSEAETLAAAGTKEDVQLIQIALATNLPVLVNLDGVPTVVQAFEHGKKSSFEALYDNAVTPVELRKMQQAGVKTPAEIPPQAWRAECQFGMAFNCRIDVAVFAANNGDVRNTIRQLLHEDSGFQTAVLAELINQVTTNMFDTEICSFSCSAATSAEYEAFDPPLDPTVEPRWRILELD